MSTRLLALLVALCAMLPVQLWGRLAEACETVDACRCRHDDDRQPTAPLVQRTDCCAAPPAATPTTPCPASTARGDQLLAPAQPTELPPTPLSRADGLELTLPHARMRGPPQRWFGRIQHWLL